MTCSWCQKPQPLTTLERSLFGVLCLDCADPKWCERYKRADDPISAKEPKPPSCGKCEGWGNPSFGHTKECREYHEAKAGK